MAGPFLGLLDELGQPGVDGVPFVLGGLGVEDRGEQRMGEPEAALGPVHDPGLGGHDECTGAGLPGGRDDEGPTLVGRAGQFEQDLTCLGRERGQPVVDQHSEVGRDWDRLVGPERGVPREQAADLQREQRVPAAGSVHPVERPLPSA